VRNNKNLKMGMVGGGPGAFIGSIHRKSARLTGSINLVAGAFDIDSDKSIMMGKELGLDDNRIYRDHRVMIERELKLQLGERIDFVAITTPNNWHFPIAKDFLEAGFHVMCEKPMTMNVAEAKQLCEIVKQTGRVFGLMHNYTGYPMIKLAKDLVRDNDFGEIRKVIVQYPQDWLSKPIEADGQKQASWRTDPAQSGATGSMGDIGTHAENLTEYVTGLTITHVCADLNTFLPNRRLDDDGNCLLRFDNGARGILHESQISVGEENNLAIWIYGEKMGIEWHQENPNYLRVKEKDKPEQIWKRGNSYVAETSPAADRGTILPPGHPEGFIEAFANVYANFADTILAKMNNENPDELMLDFPTVKDGLRGMRFIESVLKSSQSNEKWTELDTD